MENQSNNEKEIGKVEVFDVLREKGPDSQEYLDAVIEWRKQIEGKAVNSKDAIVINIESIDFYIAVGNIHGAIDCLRDALYQAEQEGEKDLREGILRQLDKLEGKKW